MAEPAASPATPRVPPSSLWGWIIPLPRQRGRGAGYVLRWLVGRALLFYGLICLMLASFQRSLIYHPSQEARIVVEDARLPPGVVHDVTVPSPAGDLHGWHMLPAGEAAASREECDARLAAARVVVLYFPGNAGNRTHRVDEMRLLSQLGAHVFLIDYRGYADNPGSPSETALHEDARAAWRMLTEERHVPARKIVLFGESLGGGPATRLASDLSKAGTPPAGLILRASFSSLSDTGACHFPWLPVRWLLLDTYRSDLVIGAVTCPILQIHGALDTIVPVELGRKLFAAAPEQSASGIPKQFVELPRADHNDIRYVARDSFTAAVRQFLQRLPP